MIQLYKSDGFTLLEILVALAILAIALSTAIKVSSHYTENARYLRDKTFAHWVAMNVLTEIQVRGKPLETTEGTTAMGNQTWFWKVETVPTEEKELKRLEVKVFYKQEDTETVAKVTGFLSNSH